MISSSRIKGRGQRPHLKTQRMPVNFVVTDLTHPDSHKMPLMHHMTKTIRWKENTQRLKLHENKLVLHFV